MAAASMAGDASSISSAPPWGRGRAKVVVVDAASSAMVMEKRMVGLGWGLKRVVSLVRVVCGLLLEWLCVGDESRTVGLLYVVEAVTSVVQCL